MNNMTAAAVGTVMALSLWGCSDRSISGPPDPSVDPPAPPPHGMVVSNAIARASGAGGGTVAFVSAVPGTFQRATSAWVMNESRGGVPGFVHIVDGGFDPVAVEAKEGDDLRLTVFVPNAESLPVRVRVPARCPPAVVRTNPGNGRFDQPVDVKVVTVFSEPVETSTITSSTVSLMREGTPVGGRPAVSEDGLSVEFVSTDGLEPGMDYSIVITDGVRDLAGDGIAASYAVSFATAGVRSTQTGLELIFSRLADGQIYRVRIDGTGLTRMTTDGNNLRPVWSPDGSRIAFARNVRGPANRGFGITDIYLMSPDGGDGARLTASENFWSAEWSPDGASLAVSDEGTYYGDIWIIGAHDASSPVRIATQARSPAWSPDGRKIAFVALSGDDGYHQVVVMNADGSDHVPLSENDGGGIYGLGWSPDGKRIAFSKCLWDRGCDIYVMNADGSGLEQITSLGNVNGAEWSPDGVWIAFTQSYYSGREWLPSIGYVPANGGVARIVSDGYWPSWRPLAR